MKMREGDRIVLAFDGSHGREDAPPDSTVIVGLRMPDERHDKPHIFVPKYIGADTIWEAPPENWQSWHVPVLEVDAAMRELHHRYVMVAMACDPSGWEQVLAGWEADFGDRAIVKCSERGVFTWPIKSARRNAEAVDLLGQAIRRGNLTHDGNETLRRHVLNARMRPTGEGWKYLTIGKERDGSPRKIDAAWGAVMAWRLYLEVLKVPSGRKSSRARFTDY